MTRALTILDTSPMRLPSDTALIVAPRDRSDLFDRIVSLGTRPAEVRIDGAGWYVGTAVSALVALGCDPVVHVGSRCGVWAESSTERPTPTPVLRVDATWLRNPEHAISVRVGGPAELGEDGGVVGFASRLAGSIAGPEASAWSVSADAAGEAPLGWGLAATSTGRIAHGIHVSIAPRADAFGLVRPDPARGGGLLGFVRGVAGLFSGTSVESAGRVVLRGQGSLMIDDRGVSCDEPGAIAVAAGPTVRLVRWAAAGN